LLIRPRTSPTPSIAAPCATPRNASNGSPRRCARRPPTGGSRHCSPLSVPCAALTAFLWDVARHVPLAAH
jgi:hypothetical protein